MSEHVNAAERRDWLVEVEGLRAVAFVFIVFGHAVGVLAFIPHGVASMGAFGAVLALTRFALLAFMTISGILIGRRAASGKPMSSWRSFERLVVPYALWTVLYLLVTKALQGTSATTAPQLVAEFARALVTGSGFYHLWYVVVAIQIVVVGPLVAKFLLPMPTTRRLIALATVVAVNIILIGQVAGPITRRLPASSAVFGSGADRIILFWLTYVTAGVIIGLEYHKIVGYLARRRVALWAVYAVSAVAVTVLVVNQAVRVEGDYQAVAGISRVLQPWIVPFQLLAVIAWLDISGVLMRGRAAESMSRLSAVSFGGYLVHPFWILVGTQFVYTRVVSPEPVVFVLALTGFALSASYLTVWLAGRATLPIGTALFGSQGRG